MKNFTLFFVALFFAFSIQAQDEQVIEEVVEEYADDSYGDSDITADSLDIMEAFFEQYIDSINSKYTYETGTIDLGEGLAYMDVPEGYKYLDPDQSLEVLSEVWGNPPEETMGMLFHEDQFPLSDNFSFVIDITYAEDGYVEDEDAGDIDYDELLEQMQEETEEIQPTRIEMGYPTYDLVGWATPPRYDHESKKLFWAMELAFEDTETNTLNYDMRILGRKGYLVLTAIGDMSALPLVEAESPMILDNTHFNEGYTYGEFDPSMDKVAAGGIAALVAGKVLAKAGILAKLGIFFAKFWKILAVGVIAVGAGFKRFFGRKDPEIPG